jgi:excisionase family DNA binding protein
VDRSESLPDISEISRGEAERSTLVDRIQAELLQVARRVHNGEVTIDMHFLGYLLATSQFGYFTFGPITLDVRVIEDIVERTTPRQEPWKWGMHESNSRFAATLVAEVKRSGRRRLDELHYLLAFMRTKEGLPERVFGELGVTPAEVETYSRDRSNARVATAEKLYSPEEAADYLGVHVKTVRGWIRDGRLRASRLAGQRALRITASDLQAVLEPLGEDTDA